MTERLRGRAAVAQRKRRLDLYPICAHCWRDKGIATQTDEIDHVTPLAMGGDDTDSNTQGLCFTCHAIKTAGEDASHGGSATHPTWLRPSAIPITIITGPPCSGKTTYAKQHAAPADTIIDLDEIVERQTGKHGHHHTGTEHLTAAIRERNAILGSLSRAKQGKAWLIVGAPSPAERTWWQAQLGGEVILLNPGKTECMKRAASRQGGQHKQAIEQWYRREAQPWTAPEARKPKPAIAYDGTPEGWE